MRSEPRLQMKINSSQRAKEPLRMLKIEKSLYSSSYAIEMPSYTHAWILKEQNGIDGLESIEQALPEVGDFEVLVKVHAASLNYRDIVLANVRQSPKCPY